MYLVAVFGTDPASLNIAERLKEEAEWKKEKGGLVHKNLLMREYEGEHLYTDHPVRAASEKGFDIEGIIVLSRHRAASGKPTLTVHPTGNFGKAEYGGQDSTLSTSFPRMMGGLLRALKMNAADLDFAVSLEVTHHGPLSDLPLCFIEIGSDESKWGLEEPARAIARAVLEPDIREIPVAIGIGGGHYAPRFTDLCLEGRCDFGHMLPNYHLGTAATEGTVRMMAERTPGAAYAVLHGRTAKGSKDILRGVETAGLSVLGANP